MIHAKNYKTVSPFIKVVQIKLLTLFLDMVYLKHMPELSKVE